MANRILPVPPDGLTEVDALAIAQILVYTQRAIPIDEWIPDYHIQMGIDTFRSIL